MQKPPPDFRTNFEATHPPILIDNGLAILENDKIERHIMKNIPGGYNLFVQVMSMRDVNFDFDTHIRHAYFNFTGQRGGNTHRKCLLKIEVNAVEKGRGEK